MIFLPDYMCAENKVSEILRGFQHYEKEVVKMDHVMKIWNFRLS